MKLINYKNSSDDEMIIVINEENDTAESMSKIEYDRRKAALSTPMVLTYDNLTPPDTIESTQPDEADLTEGTN